MVFNRETQISTFFSYGHRDPKHKTEIRLRTPTESIRGPSLFARCTTSTYEHDVLRLKGDKEMVSMNEVQTTLFDDQLMPWRCYDLAHLSNICSGSSGERTVS